MCHADEVKRDSMQIVVGIVHTEYPLHERPWKESEEKISINHRQIMYRVQWQIL